jgi:hypothetical protein
MTTHLTCFIESCWNKVYTCAYQQFAVTYANFCFGGVSDDIPFWPAPADAPDACSCNMENVYDEVIVNINEASTCLERVTDELATDDPLQTIANSTGCQCCAASGAVSAAYNICPDTDPSLLEINDQLQLGVSLIILDADFGSCDSTLDDFDCVADLQFPSLPDGQDYYANSTLPTSGTESLSDTDGSITSPPYGSTTTLSILGTSTVLTAASYSQDSSGGDQGGGSNDNPSDEGGNGSQPEETGSPGDSGTGRREVGWLTITICCVAAWLYVL